MNIVRHRRELSVPLALLLGISLFVILSLQYAWSDLSFLIGGNTRVFDDAFYYFQVAKNAALGWGLTFDRINPTNGFQPLWMMLIIPVYTIFKFSFETPIHVILTLQVLVGVGALLLQFKTLSQGVGSISAIAIILVFLNDYFIRNVVSGMETALVVFSLSWIVYFWTTRSNHRDSIAFNSIVLGIISGTLILSRLDAVLLVLVIFLLSNLSSKHSKSKSISWPISLITLALILFPYFIWNVIYFGHIAPISGFVKSSFPQFLLIDRLMTGEWQSLLWPNWITIVTIAFVCEAAILLQPSFRAIRFLMLLVALFLFRVNAIFIVLFLSGMFDGFYSDHMINNGHITFNQIVRYLAIFGICLMIFELSFLRWGIMYWHYSWIELVLAPFLAIRIGNFIGRSFKIELSKIISYVKGRTFLRLDFITKRRIQFIAIIVLLLLSGRAFWKTTSSYHNQLGSNTESSVLTWQHVSYTAAVWASRNLPPDATLAMSDAGVFGYFSDRKVINLDGVINGFEYQYALQQGHGVEWLGQKGVQYLVFHAVDEDHYAVYTYNLPSRKFRNIGGTLKLLPYQEVYRSQQYTDMGKTVRLIIWRLDFPAQAG